MFCKITVCWITTGMMKSLWLKKKQSASYVFIYQIVEIWYLKGDLKPKYRRLLKTILFHQKTKSQKAYMKAAISLLCMFLWVDDATYVEKHFIYLKFCKVVSSWKIFKSIINFCRQFFLHKINKNITKARVKSWPQAPIKIWKQTKLYITYLS